MDEIQRIHRAAQELKRMMPTILPAKKNSQSVLDKMFEELFNAIEEVRTKQMKTNEPRSVVKHTRTITTFYFSDELNEEQLKSKIELFLEELQLPDSYEEFDVQPVTNECPSEEIDEVKTLSKEDELESELTKHNIPYDLAMEGWYHHKQEMQWLPK